MSDSEPDRHGFDALHGTVQHHIVNTLRWSELRPLQDLAAAPIIADHDVLLLAPTAGGKTEAAVFPLLSRMLAEHWNGLSVLYVCPLRALLNDLHLRLEEYSKWVGRTCGLWHGDVGPGERSRIMAGPPDILLTTPESIEAILLSRGRDHAALFSQLRTIVVDEVHAFAGDDRGWHLQLVLARIRELTGRPLQRIGLSATVGNPVQLLDWLAEDSARIRSVIDGNDASPPSMPATEVDVTVDVAGSVANTATVIASMHQREKRLVFCESRARVEELAVALRAREVTTFVSHSSLSVGERRDAERGFREERDCVIVSTSTLELGIDVGDLDHVILVDPPKSVASFLQRIGRAGRRSGARRSVLFLLPGQGLDVAQALGLLLLWRRGYVEPVTPPREPLHLIAQQALGMVLQDRGAGRNELEARLAKRTAFGKDRDLVHAVISHLIETDFLFDDGGILGVGTEAEATLGFRHFIELTSSFTSDPLFTVKNGNKDIGFMDPMSFFKKDGTLGTIILSGRVWQVTNIDWARTVCWVETSDAQVGGARWTTNSGALSGELCQATRDVLAGDEPSGLRVSKRAQAKLDELRAQFHWVSRDATTIVRDTGSIWWTFAGGKANRQLEAAVGGTSSNSWAVYLATDADSSELRTRLGAATAIPGPSAVAVAALREGLKFSECLKVEIADRVVELRARDDESYRKTAALRVNSFHQTQDV